MRKEKKKQTIGFLMNTQTRIRRYKIIQIFSANNRNNIAASLRRRKKISIYTRSISYVKKRGRGGAIKLHLRPYHGNFTNYAPYRCAYTWQHCKARKYNLYVDKIKIDKMPISRLRKTIFQRNL